MILAVALIVIVVVLIGWVSQRGHFLDGIRAEAEPKLHRKYSAEEAEQIRDC